MLAFHRLVPPAGEHCVVASLDEETLPLLLLALAAATSCPQQLLRLATPPQLVACLAWMAVAPYFVVWQPAACRAAQVAVAESTYQSALMSRVVSSTLPAYSHSHRRRVALVTSIRMPSTLEPPARQTNTLPPREMLLVGTVRLRLHRAHASQRARAGCAI